MTVTYISPVLKVLLWLHLCTWAQLIVLVLTSLKCPRARVLETSPPILPTVLVKVCVLSPDLCTFPFIGEVGGD